MMMMNDDDDDYIKVINDPFFAQMFKSAEPTFALQVIYESVT